MGEGDKEESHSKKGTLSPEMAMKTVRNLFEGPKYTFYGRNEKYAFQDALLASPLSDAELAASLKPVFEQYQAARKKSDPNNNWYGIQDAFEHHQKAYERSINAHRKQAQDRKEGLKQGHSGKEIQKITGNDPKRISGRGGANELSDKHKAVLQSMHNLNQRENKKGAARYIRNDDPKIIEHLENTGHIQQREGYHDAYRFLTKKGKKAIGVENERIPGDVAHDHIVDIWGGDKKFQSKIKQQIAMFLNPGRIIRPGSLEKTEFYQGLIKKFGEKKVNAALGKSVKDGYVDIANSAKNGSWQMAFNAIMSKLK